jgi:hypothetical protein
MLYNFKVGDFIYSVDKNEIIKFEIKEIIPYKYVGEKMLVNEEGIWLDNSPGKRSDTQLLQVENTHSVLEHKQEHEVFAYRLNTFNKSTSHGWFSTSELAIAQFTKLNPPGSS